MTYREAWETIYFKHCQETCDYAYMDNCQEEKCEYYMALQALNRQYYAECGSVWVKPKADRKTEPQTAECPFDDAIPCEWACTEYGKCKYKTEPTISKMEQVEDEPQTVDLGNGFSITANGTKTPNYCGTCKYREVPCGDLPCDVCHGYSNYEPKDESQADYDKGLKLFADILFDKEKSGHFLKECKAIGIDPQTERSE